ncbi:MAG: type II secretion system F family protein, partial [Pseudomonadota bacterium]
FETSNSAPPPETAFVLKAGQLVREWGWALPAVFLGSVLLVRFIRKRYQLTLDRLTLNLPLIGQLAKISEMARFCRSLGALLVGGCSMTEALPIARAAVFNRSLFASHEATANGVRLGQSLSDAAASNQLFPDEALELIRIGERTGQLGSMLLQASSSGEEQVTSTLKTISGVLGPLLTALMGAMTAGVIAAVMIGVMSLNEAVY